MAKAETLFSAALPEQRYKARPLALASELPMEQIAKLEKQMSQVYIHCQNAGHHFGSDLLNLVLAKLLANEGVKNFVDRQEQEIL